MTDATALVDRLIGVAKSLPKERFFDLFDLLVQEGAPPAEANTTVNMCQAAFGRAFLSDFGISFSNRYFKFAPDGTILEEGLVAAA